MKERLDVLLANRGLASSREKAKAMIMEGIVYVNGQKEDKAGTLFDTEAPLEVRGTALPYVSRGGLKLEKSVKSFSLNLNGLVCLDVGASTGGFTDCMLQNGAAQVYAIDRRILYFADKGAGAGEGASEIRWSDRVPGKAAV